MLKYFIAVLPAIIVFVLYIIFDKDKNRKKNTNLLLLFIIGCIGSYICYRIEMHIGGYFPKIKKYGYIASIFYAIFGVAVFEEGYKWFFTNVFTINKKLKNIEMMEYAFFVSLGFAVFENVVYYVSKYGLSNSISRFFTAVPLHLICSIIMGYFLTKKDNKIRNNCLGLIIPTLVHAFYNSFLYMKIDGLEIYSFLLIIIISLYIFYKYVKIRVIEE